MELHSEFKQLAQSVAREGGRLFVVGGAVRDDQLGLEPRDIDLLLVGPGKEVFGDRVEGLVPDVFGVTIDGRLVEVKEARYLNWDLGSRDFTVNAMAWDILKGKLHDPYWGVRDIDLRNLSPVGVKCFTNSPERVYRLAALASRLGFDAHEGIALARSTITDELLATVPDEQRFRQLDRMARGWGVGYGLEVLNRLGVIDCDPDTAGRIEAVARQFEADKRPAIVFAMAGLPLAGGPLGLHQRVGKLRTSRGAETVADVRLLADLIDPVTVEELAYVRSDGDLLGLAIVAGVVSGPLPWLVRGADAIEAGVGEGPEVGRVLLAIREAQFHDVVRTRKEALRLAGQGGWNADGVRRFAGLGVDGH